MVEEQIVEKVPVTTYRPVEAFAPAPVVTTSYYAPVVTTYKPVVTVAPTVTYLPVVVAP
jgi:hypothetical protein